MTMVDEKYENIAKLAQKFVADYPVIVIGSGLSIPHRQKVQAKKVLENSLQKSVYFCSS